MTSQADLIYMKGKLENMQEITIELLQKQNNLLRQTILSITNIKQLKQIQSKIRTMRTK